jgi:1-aminocyclopropane-1-carboxylate deaminase/D-cysteine desulfhydrase-like pyridoxal-dependent ACC family enzyme
MKYPIKIENHDGIFVLRDDLLPGGTKSILLEQLDRENPNITEFVYASPVYGGFQIALASYFGKEATIFCAQRQDRHPNTIKAKKLGAKLKEVYPGYLSVVERRAKDYCEKRKHCMLLEFGAQTDKNIDLIAERCMQVLKKMKTPPDEIWVAVGSGTIVQGILKAVKEYNKKIKVVGVLVGKDFKKKDPNLKLIRYPKEFDEESKFEAAFPSMPNYDLKAFEICFKSHQKNPSKTVLFWNVL